MKQKNSLCWIYLARRDKKAVRILAKAAGKNVMANRVEDLSQLGLPENWLAKINNIAHENRMLWELWIESFDNFEELRAALYTRGYSNIPMSPQPEITLFKTNMPNLNLSSFSSRKTMLQKKI